MEESDKDQRKKDQLQVYGLTKLENQERREGKKLNEETPYNLKEKQRQAGEKSQQAYQEKSQTQVDKEQK